MKLRVLIVDDSPFIRRMINDWFKTESDIEVVGHCKDGDEAVEKTKSLKPDVVTMDVEMPKRDGISALREIMADCPTAVLMVSSVTLEGAKLTLKALELGAVDFVTKPQGGSSLKFIEAKEELLEKVRAAKHARLSATKQPVSKVGVVRRSSDKVFVIACSTGGPKALSSLWAALPKGFPSPILIVQHMPEGFTASLALRLDSLGTVPCKEATERDKVTRGLALIAPGGRHMLVRPNGSIELNDEPTIHGVRPSADLLFNSVAEVYSTQVVGTVLTGMGRDGANGAANIRKAGGFMLGESEETAAIYGMPKAAKDAGGIDAEFPLHEMAHALVSKLAGRTKVA